MQPHSRVLNRTAMWLCGAVACLHEPRATVAVIPASDPRLRLAVAHDLRVILKRQKHATAAVAIAHRKCARAVGPWRPRPARWRIGDHGRDVPALSHIGPPALRVLPLVSDPLVPRKSRLRGAERPVRVVPVRLRL
eukprot:7389707-Prymnesium_polylepis.3